MNLIKIRSWNSNLMFSVIVSQTFSWFDFNEFSLSLSLSLRWNCKQGSVGCLKSHDKKFNQLKGKFQGERCNYHTRNDFLSVENKQTKKVSVIKISHCLPSSVSVVYLISMGVLNAVCNSSSVHSYRQMQGTKDDLHVL